MTGAQLLDSLRVAGHRLGLRRAGVYAVPRPEPAVRALLAGPEGPRLRQELRAAWWADPLCDLCRQPLAGVTATGRFLCAEHGAEEDMGHIAHKEESENAMKLKVTDPTYELPELGWHDAILTKVTEKAITFNGELSDCFEWHFELSGGDLTIRGLSSQAFSPRSKAYTWASALLEIDGELDTDDLENLACRVRVGHKPPNANGLVFAQILEVKGPKPVAAATKAKVLASVPDDDEAPF